MTKLRAISVLVPSHALKQPSISHIERDQVTAAAMVRSENKGARFQFSKGAFNVSRPKARAVASYDYNFVVTQPADFRDGVFQPCGETGANLSMKPRSFVNESATRSENVNVNPGRKF